MSHYFHSPPPPPNTALLHSPGTSLLPPMRVEAVSFPHDLLPHSSSPVCCFFTDFTQPRWEWPSGAFGSHGLRARNPPMSERSISNWGIASNYLIYNGIALLAISFHPSLALSRRARMATGMITSGTLIFSGSILGLVLGKEGWRKVLGPITPLGGMAMIGGYVFRATLLFQVAGLWTDMSTASDDH